MRKPKFAAGRRPTSVGAVFFISLFLAACSGGGSSGGLLGLLGPGGGGASGLACPRVAVLQAPSELTRFTGAPSGNITEVLFQAQLTATNVTCEIEEKEVYVTADARLRVARGPADKKGEAAFSFFVAVLNGRGEVILRQAFPIVVQFDENEPRLEFEDSVTIQIDKQPNVDVATYSVYAGFEMTPEELEFNRRRQR